MSARVFIDTNVIVYANDRRDPAKQQRAMAVVAEHMRSGTAVVSTQVLQEYANVALTQLKQEDAVVLRILRLLESLKVVSMSAALVRRAVEIRKVYDVGFWDACIIGAAEEADCDSILSEDFNADQYYGGIVVVNPFSKR